MRAVVGCRIAHRRLHHSRHVLDRHHTQLRGGHGVGLAEMCGDTEMQRERFLGDRLQQVRRDLGVDLDVVRSRHRPLVHRLARFLSARHRRRAGVGRRHAVDHRPGGENPRSDDGAEIEIVLEVVAGVGGRMEIPDRRDAPREVARHGPTLDVGVGIDQPRDDRFSHQVNALGATRDGDLVDPRDGLDVAVFNKNEGIGLGRAPGAVDQGGALEHDRALAGAAAGGEHPHGTEQGATSKRLHGLGSAEV